MKLVSLIWYWIVIRNTLDHSCRISSNCCTGWNIIRHDGSGSDHSTIADGDSFEYDGTCANETFFPDANRPTDGLGIGEPIPVFSSWMKISIENHGAASDNGILAHLHFIGTANQAGT